MLNLFRGFILFCVFFTQLIQPTPAHAIPHLNAHPHVNHPKITHSSDTHTYHPIHPPTTHPNNPHPTHPTTTHPNNPHPTHPTTTHSDNTHDPTLNPETFYPRDIPSGLESLNVVCIGPDSSDTNGSVEGKYKVPTIEIGGKLAGGHKAYKGGRCFSSIKMDTQYQKTRVFADMLKDVKQTANFGIGAGVASQLIDAYANLKEQSIEEGKPLDPCKPVALHIEGNKTFYEVYDSNNCSVMNSKNSRFWH